MFGAIYGDISGSIYQDKKVSKNEIILNQKNMYFTDDTVLTIALMKVFDSLYPNLFDTSEEVIKDKLIKTMKSLVREYPEREYGERFFEWATSAIYYQPHSIGNGSAMRVSPCAYIGSSIGEVRYLARTTASITHDTKDGIIGAEAIASSIYLAKEGYTKEEILSYIEREFYPSIRKIKREDIIDNDSFDCTSKYTVPVAIHAFIESTSFEDAIITAISYGGDTDTIASMAGAISEAYYKDIDRLFYKKQLDLYLPSELIRIVNRFDKLYYNNYKYLFVDVDGVLNNHRYNSRRLIGSKEMDIDNINILKRIIYNANLKVVITSSRCDTKYTLDELKEEFNYYNIKIEDYLVKIGITKAGAIQQYLKANSIKYYCVLDDHHFDFPSYFINNFVRINPDLGLTEEYIETIIHKLKVSSYIN